MKRFKVYIAGPYSGGNVGENISKAMTAWHQLSNAGFSPFCPHLSHYLHIHFPKEYDFWLAYDIEWLSVCDVLFRLPGDSPGADKEIEYAKENGIPVFTDFDELINWMRKEQEK